MIAFQHLYLSLIPQNSPDDNNILYLSLLFTTNISPNIFNTSTLYVLFFIVIFCLDFIKFFFLF